MEKNFKVQKYVKSKNNIPVKINLKKLSTVQQKFLARNITRSHVCLNELRLYSLVGTSLLLVLHKWRTWCPKEYAVGHTASNLPTSHTLR